MDSENFTAAYAGCIDEEIERPVSYAEVLQSDSPPADPTCLESTENRLGTKPIDARRYYSREFFELENEKLWPHVWQYAAWSYDIEKPGDIAVYRNAGRSVLIVRQKDGSIKAFANSCLHRGRELCTEEFQHQDKLACPFHGFTWALDGELAWYPCRWDFPQVNADTHRLPEIRCEQWNGFVFINFDKDAPSLRDYLGKMVDQWEATPSWNFHNRYRAINVVKKLRLNWKTCQEAFIESFHAYFSHPGTEKTGDAVGSQYDIWPDEPHFSRMLTAMARPSGHLQRPQPTDEEVFEDFLHGWAPEMIGSPDAKMLPGETPRQTAARLAKQIYAQRGVDLSGAPASYTLDTIEYFVFPHFFPWPSLGAPLVYRFRPGETPDECIWDTALFLPFSGERPPSGRTVYLDYDEPFTLVPELGYLGFVLQQDVDNLEPMQRGLKASIAKKVTLAEYQEVRIRHYHETLDRYLGI